MRGRSRDRHNDRPIQSNKVPYLMEEMNLDPGPTAG